MIRAGFLRIEDRIDMIALARDGSVAHRLARRANALVLLDDGWSCTKVASVLFVDDDTVRAWYGLYAEDGFDGLGRFEVGGSLSRMSCEEQERLKVWITATLPHSTRQIGAFIAAQFDFSYEGRSGLIALLNRLGITYHKPQLIPRKLAEAAQRNFIEAYQKLLNSLGQDETVLFADAVHPTHAAKPAGCWECQESCVWCRFSHYLSENLSSKIMAKWVFASVHSRGGIFQSWRFDARPKTTV